METRTYNVYKFDELSEEGKEKAIQNLQNINVDFDWWEDDGLLDVEQSEWVKFGLKGCLFRWKKIYFNINRDSHLQFEGLEITNATVFRKALKISEKAWNKTNYCFNNGYSRYPETHLTFGDPEIYSSSKLFTEKEKMEIDRAIGIFDGWREQALINLRKNYEYLTSEKSIVETIKANDYFFTENGKID